MTAALKEEYATVAKDHHIDPDGNIFKAVVHRTVPRADTKVIIAYLTNGVDVTHTWHVSMRSMELYDARRARHIVGIAPTMCQSGSLAKSRNQVTAAFLNEGKDANWLLFSDTDHGFRADALEKLMKAADPEKVPVVGALTTGIALDQSDGLNGFRFAPRICAFSWDGTGFTRALTYPEDTLWPVHATGTGFLLLHRNVLEKVGGDWFTVARDGQGTELGEDLSLMRRLIDLDVPVHVHTGVPTSHVKPMWLQPGDWATP